MIFIIAILLYNHPTLSDSWLMWTALIIIGLIRWFLVHQTREQLKALTVAVNVLARR